MILYNLNKKEIKQYDFDEVFNYKIRFTNMS